MNIYMLLVSLTILFSFITAIYLGKYIISIPSLFVFITSVIFWSNPENEWKMYIDIFVVQFALYFSVYYAYTYLDRKNFISYIFILSVAIIYYLFAILSWNINPFISEDNIKFFKTITLLLHSMGTFIANYSNLFMYLCL